MVKWTRSTTGSCISAGRATRRPGSCLPVILVWIVLAIVRANPATSRRCGCWRCSSVPPAGELCTTASDERSDPNGRPRRSIAPIRPSSVSRPALPSSGLETAAIQGDAHWISAAASGSSTRRQGWPVSQTIPCKIRRIDIAPLPVALRSGSPRPRPCTGRWRFSRASPTGSQLHLAHYGHRIRSGSGRRHIRLRFQRAVKMACHHHAVGIQSTRLGATCRASRRIFAPYTVIERRFGPHRRGVPTACSPNGRRTNRRPPGRGVGSAALLSHQRRGGNPPSQKCQA